MTWSPGGPERAPFRVALREARQAWILAQQTAARELEAQLMLEADAGIEHAGEAYRRAALLRDRGGHLHHAREAARGAMLLASTPAERYQVTLLLTRILCDMGCHAEELAEARKLVAMQPHRAESLAALRRAARCRRRWGLWQWACDRLEAESQARESTSTVGTSPNGTALP